MRKALFLLVLAKIPFLLFAQSDSETLLQTARDLSVLFPEDNVALLKASSTFDFFIDSKSETLQVSHMETESYLALRSNASFVKRIYTNDNSFIENYTLLSEKGKRYDHSKYCGHYQSDDIFYSDAQVCAYKFYFNVQGRPVDFSAKTVYTDTKYLTYVFFHDEIPTLAKEIKFTIPGWADVELVEINFAGFEIKKEVTKGESTTYTYTINNIKALPKDENAPGYLHYLPHILILTKSYSYKANKINVLSSTDDLYAWYYSLTSQINHNQDELKEKVKEITTGLNTDKEKIEAIYYWVQDNIKYIAFENGLAGFKPEDASKVYFNRYGDCKGMANLAKEMLLIAGFDARLTWVGTSQIPYTYDIPTLAVDNHMICTVFSKGEQYILDPTEKHNPLGHEAERIQGKQILIENGSSYIIDTVREASIEAYLNESHWVFNVKDGMLMGTGKTAVNGEYKKNILNVLGSLSQQDKDKFLTAVIAGGGNPDNFKVTKYSELSRKNPLTIEYNYTLSNNINSFNDELYLTLDFSEEYKDVLLEKDRTIPFYFGEKGFDRILGEIAIPAGYALNYLPASFHFKNDYFSFDLRYEMQKDKILYSKEIKILRNTLPVSQFENWNAAISEVSKFYNDQIILKADE